MGEIADDIIDGVFDYISGEYIGEGVGFPRTKHGSSNKADLEADRLKYAKEKITELGYVIIEESKSELSFMFNNQLVKIFPFTGWHTGKSIIDGRGIKNLLKQIKI